MAQLIWGGYTSDGVVTIYIDGQSYEYGGIDAAVIHKLEYRFTKDPFGVLNQLKDDCTYWVGPNNTFHERSVS